MKHQVSTMFVSHPFQALVLVQFVRNRPSNSASPPQVGRINREQLRHKILHNFIHSLETVKYTSHPVRKHRYNAPICLWMTTAILDALKVKEYFYEKLKQNKEDEYYLNQYRHHRNTSLSLIRKRKKEHYPDPTKSKPAQSKKILGGSDCCSKKAIPSAVGKKAASSINILQTRTCTGSNFGLIRISELLDSESWK